VTRRSIGEPDASGSRALPPARRLRYDGDSHPLALGCTVCPDRKVCGGLRVAAGFSCMDRCCGGRAGCDVVCPGNPEFAERVREVAGFDLAGVPRAPTVPLASTPLVVPLLYGGVSRTGYGGAAVALPLFRLLRRGEPASRFASLEEVAAEFRFAAGAAVVLSGTANDRPLERWWSLGKPGRRRAARALASLGVHAATSLNFSMFIDRPRHDDLHSAKRIALVWQEMVDEGLPTALHVNARTDEDWRRWSAFVAVRPEVDAISYEFGTGAGATDRMGWHVAGLVQLAEAAGRPLRLLVRGGQAALPILIRSFDSVSFIDTTAYMKTMKRHLAQAQPDGSLGWMATPTDPGQPLDHIFEHNARSIAAAAIRSASTPCSLTERGAGA